MDEFEPITPLIEPYINLCHADLPDEVKRLVRTSALVSFTDLDDPPDLSAGRLIRPERGLASTGVVDRRAATSDGGAQSFPKPGEPCFLVHWDALSPSQRLEAARQWDLNHDPAYEAEGQAEFDAAGAELELEQQIEEMQRAPATSATDIIAKRTHLGHVQAKLEELRSARSASSAFAPIVEPERCGPTPSVSSESQSVSGKGKARGTRGFAASDAPLIDEMERITLEEGISDWAAACRVAPRAKGSANAQAREKRLVRGLQKRRDTGSFEKL